MRESFLRREFYKGIAACFLSGILLFTMNVSVFAEGSKELTQYEGYRPYTERNESYTVNKQRLSEFHIYMEAGEKLYLGTSVKDAKLYNTNEKNSGLFTKEDMGVDDDTFNDEDMEYLNSAEMCIRTPDWDQTDNPNGLPFINGVRDTSIQLIDITNNVNDEGFIDTRAKEANGPNVNGTTTGYSVKETNDLAPSSDATNGVKSNANVYTAEKSGIYTFIPYAQGVGTENPTSVLVDSDEFFQSTFQKNNTIGAWDASVYKGNEEQTGRLFADTLFLNMGGNISNKKVLNSKVYVLTNDGYIYHIDFNGMDPYGFEFFANNRGLLTKNADETTSSLGHSVKSMNNQMDDLVLHNLIINNIPHDNALDHTYRIFLNEPSDTIKAALNIPTSPAEIASEIHNFKFAGSNCDIANTGYVGDGGDFSFEIPQGLEATAYEISLVFGTDNVVTLGNSLVSGFNKIHWNGLDANGEKVKAGTYSTASIEFKLKGGEIHFPLLDVENNPYGIKLTRINGSNSGDTTVYYNNSSSNIGDVTSPWTVNNWIVADKQNAMSGVSSTDGAMVYTNGGGNQCALDIWANYNTPVTLARYDFSLINKDEPTTAAPTTEASTTETTTTTETPTTAVPTTATTAPETITTAAKKATTEKKKHVSKKSNVATTKDSSLWYQWTMIGVTALGIAMVVMTVKRKR